jgi:hypothetical protein
MLKGSEETNDIGDLYDFTKDVTLIRENWRLMNNQYKKSLLTETRKLIKKNRIVLMDSCCGKLGDLFKWIKIGITDIIGIDISFIELYGDNGAEQRLITNGFIFNGTYYTNGIQNIYLVWGDMTKPLKDIGYRKEDNMILNEFLNEYKKVDIISNMYCIHYFFGEYSSGKWKKSDKLIKQFKDNVDNILNNDGYLIGLFLNGEKINESLKDVLIEDERKLIDINKTFILKK